MNNEKFSEVRGLLGVAPPPLPTNWPEYREYRSWYLHFMHSFTTLLSSPEPEEVLETWQILQPYLADKPDFVQTLKGMLGSHTFLSYQVGKDYDDWTGRAAVAHLAFHKDLIYYEKGLRWWVANHLGAKARTGTNSPRKYKGPLEIPYAAFWEKSLRLPDYFWHTGTTFGTTFNAAFREDTQDVFLAVHDAETFYQDLELGLLRPYTKDFILSDEGNDWLTYSSWRQSTDLPEDHMHHPERRFERLKILAQTNIYATILVDKTGLLTYLSDVCYDLHLPEDENHGFFYDCYE